MMDREKIIKGFTICSEHGLLNGEDCHGHYEYTNNMANIIKANDYSKQCPYDGCKTGCVKTLAKDVFILLKEQEPVYDSYGKLRCGACRASINSSNKFCSACGRKIKWK